jgi:hypothetical protein
MTGWLFTIPVCSLGRCFVEAELGARRAERAGYTVPRTIMCEFVGDGEPIAQSPWSDLAPNHVPLLLVD